MPYPEIYPPQEEGFHPTAASRTLFVDTVGRDGSAAIVEHLAASTAPMRVAQLRVLGGAMARVPAEATAFAHRASRLMVTVVALYGRPEEAEVHQAWVDRLAAALRDGDARAYVNFLGDEGQARVREAYPESTWERLAAVKARYDPTTCSTATRTSRRPQLTPMTTTTLAQPPSRLAGHRRGPAPPRSSHGNGR